MGIREKLNDNPAIVTGVTAGIILLALIFILVQAFGGRGPRIPTRAWYSVDDGQTWFADDIRRIAPFEHRGQEAVRAHVFTCDGGRDEFVAYLERYTPEAKQRMEQARQAAEAGQPDPMMFEMVMMEGVEVKRPGDAEWVRQMDYPRSSQITAPRCPDGSTEGLEVVLP